MGTPNYNKLFQQGRLKAPAPGSGWTEAEWKALQEGVPAEYVRRGALSREAMEKMQENDVKVEKATGMMPADAMTRTALAAQANELGVQFSPATTDLELAEMIKAAQKKGASKKESDDEDESEEESDEDESEEEAPKPATGRGRPRKNA